MDARLGHLFERESELTGAVALEQLRKLPMFLDRMRGYRRSIIDAIKDIDGITIREGRDPAGDLGASLVLQFEDKSKARFFRRTIRAEHIPCDGCFAKLSYGYPAILACRTGMREDRREISFGAGGESPYQMGLCPRTEAILARSVSITVSPAYSPRDVEDIASGIRKVAAHLP